MRSMKGLRPDASSAPQWRPKGRCDEVGRPEEHSLYGDFTASPLAIAGFHSGLGLRKTTAELCFAGDLEQQIVHDLVEILFRAIHDMQLMLAGGKEGRLIARQNVTLDILEGTPLCALATARVCNPHAHYDDTNS